MFSFRLKFVCVYTIKHSADVKYENKKNLPSNIKPGFGSLDLSLKLFKGNFFWSGFLSRIGLEKLVIVFLFNSASNGERGDSEPVAQDHVQAFE